MPYSFILDIKIEWSIVSNAFLRSRNKTVFIRPLSILINHSFVISSRAVTVECSGLVALMSECQNVVSIEFIFIFVTVIK